MKKISYTIALLLAASIIFISCESDIVAVKSVELDKNTLQLVIGTSQMLTTTILPENATNRAVAWTSSHPNIATVANGVITAVATGTTTITVTTANGRKTDTSVITVVSGGTSPIL